MALTAFIPNDRTFRLRAHDVSHKWYRTENGVFDKLVKKLGIDAIEKVLVYHVVPGGPILAKDALQADEPISPPAFPVLPSRWTSRARTSR